MHLIRHRPTVLTVLAALGLSALVLAVHLHVDADDHGVSCALCVAAHHSPAVPETGPALNVHLAERVAPCTTVPTATDRGVHPAGAPRGPPLS